MLSSLHDGVGAVSIGGRLGRLEKTTLYKGLVKQPFPKRREDPSTKSLVCRKAPKLKEGVPPEGGPSAVNERRPVRHF